MNHPNHAKCLNRLNRSNHVRTTPRRPCRARAAALPLALALALALAFAAPSPARAQDGFVTDQQNIFPGEVNGGSGLSFAMPAGQEFVPAANKLDAVDLLFLGSGQVRVRLREDGIAGAVLGVSDAVTFSGSRTFARFYLPTVNLTPGRRYAIEAVPLGGTNPLLAWVRGPNPYPQGSLVLGGTRYTDSATQFRTMSDPFVDQQNLSLAGALTTRRLFTNDPLTQEFTASADRFDLLQLFVSDVDSVAPAGTITARIRQGGQGGAVLGARQIGLPRGFGQGSLPGSQIEFAFAGGLALTPGERYAIELSADVEGWGFTSQLTDAYGGGRLLDSNGSALPGDLWFATRSVGIAAAVPEPGTLALLPIAALALALALAGAARRRVAAAA